jgi:hypothetical protein
MQTIDHWLRYLSYGVTWLGLWLVIVTLCAPFLVRMARSNPLFAAVSTLSILGYGLVVTYTSGWMFGLYPISSTAISLVAPLMYAWAQSASTSGQASLDYSYFLLSTLFLLLSAFFRFDLGDDTVWFGSVVLGIGEFRLDRFPAWIPLLQEGPNEGVLLWNMLVSIPAIALSVVRMDILRRRSHYQDTQQFQDLDRVIYRKFGYLRHWVGCWLRLFMHCTLQFSYEMDSISKLRSARTSTPLRVRSMLISR